MPRIISIESSQSPIKRLWRLFQSFESFTKVTILTCLLFIIVTPYIVKNSQIFNPKAQEVKENIPNQRPDQPEFLSNQILIKVKKEVKARIKENKDNTGEPSLDKKFKEHKVKKFEKIAKEGKNSLKDADIFQWYIIELDKEAKTLKAKPDKEQARIQSEDPEMQEFLQILEQFKQDPNIEFAEPNFIVRTSQTPSPTPPSVSRVFVTSTTYTGNLGGLSGADNKCQERADTAGLGGTWKSWLSDSVTSAASRLVHRDAPYQRLDGAIIANNWLDLTDGTIQNPINVDELGTVYYEARNPWTHTDRNGNISTANLSHCSNWTGTSGGGDYGSTNSIDSRWTEGVDGSSFCWVPHHLFCFEQIDNPPTPTPTTLPPNIPNDPYYFSRGSWGQAYDDLWGLKKINTAGAWEQTKGSGDIVVADIDTGVDRNHEDLASNMWVNTAELPNNSIDDDGNGYIDDYYGCSFINMVGNVCGDPMDDNGHGTHTAGTIAAVGNNGIGVVGVNWTVRIMALKFLDSGGFGSTSGGIKALQYAADNGAKVSSNSWGCYCNSTAMDDAVKYEHDRGMITVAAAGNEDADALDLSPTSADYAITVAASDPNDLRAIFSIANNKASNWGEKIDVAAPGVDILSLRASGTDMYGDGKHFVPNGDPIAKYYRSSGTSMATPHVAGLAGLLLAKDPTLTNEEVRQIIRKGSDDLGILGKDKDYGYGRINAGGSMSLATTPPLAPIITTPQSRSIIGGTNYQFYGSVPGPNFASYKIEAGLGRSPTNWTTIASSNTQVTSNSILATVDTSKINDGVYIFRLTAIDTLGNNFQFQVHDIEVDNIDAVISSPAEAVLPGSVVNVLGSALTKNGTTFVNYTLEWGVGSSPNSWSTTGITLNNSGLLSVSNGNLGTWDTSSLSLTQEYSLRLTLNSSFVSQTSTNVVLGSACMPNFVLKWGASGSGDGQFNFPNGIAIDSKGNVYVGDVLNHRIQKFTSDGVFINKWAVSAGAGLLSLPHGVAIDSRDNVYVVDTSSDRIQKFTSEGELITTWEHSGFGDTAFNFNDPSGIVTDPSGNVYVADSGYHRIKKLTSEGELITTLGKPGPEGMNNDGEFYYPWAVTTDSKGDLYVADTYNNRIQKFTSDGAFITKWGAFGGDGHVGTGKGEFFVPFGIAIDPSGNVYVADTGNDRIQEFTSDGVFITKWGIYGLGDGQFNYPFGIAIDSSGNVYVTDTYNNRIQRFSMQCLAPPTLTILDPDISNNGVVDQADVDILSAAFLSQKGDPNYKVEYDLKPDGVINISDFGIISVNSGLTWPPANLPEGGTLKFYVIGSDPDGGALTLTASNMPSGATFDPSTGLFSWAPTFYQAGSYSPIFTVSDGNLQDSKTLPVTVVDVPRADLLISSLSTTTTVMYPGGNISLPHSLTNQGTASATSSAIAFHLSTDVTYGGTDDVAFVNTRTVSSLAAGATSSVTTWIMAIPSTTPIGTYYICAMADSGQTVPEENETNNSRCTTSTIKVALPDILVTALSGPASAVTGTSISLSTTIVNQGEGPSKSVNIGYYLSTDATITTSDTRIATLGLGSGLAPSETKTTTISGNVLSTLAAGIYYLGAIADYNSQVKESNETNNTFLGNTISVTIGADLVILSHSGPTSATRGTSISTSTIIKNQGTGSSSSSTIGFYLSTDSVITTSDTRIGTHSLSGFAAGQQQTITKTLTVPSALTPTTYYLGAIADYSNQAKENNETNNSYTGNTIIINP